VNACFSWMLLKGVRVCRSGCVLLCRREWCGGVVALLGFSACTFLPDRVLEREGRAGGEEGRQGRRGDSLGDLVGLKFLVLA
jgi:hypothetical protein